MIALAPLVVSWLLGAAFLLADGRRRWVAVSASIGLLVVFACELVLLAHACTTPHPAVEVITGGWPAGVGIRLRVDRLSLLFGSTCTAVIGAVMIHEARAGVRSRIFPALLLLLDAGLHGAFFTGDLFNFYVFFEISMVSSFALAAYGYGRAELRGTFTYVAVNLFGSALFLVGIASTYHSVGTLDFAQIAARASVPEQEPLVLSTALVFVALSLKLGLFPLHSWVPALYGNARPGVGAVLAGALVNIGAYGLLRLMIFAIHETRLGSRTVLLVLGAAAVLYGSLLAIRRRSPSEVAAYAAVVHAGYVVLALGLGGLQGLVALLIIVVAGSLDKAATFLALATRGRVRTVMALFAGASVAGLPPSFSFVAKLALLRAALETRAATPVVLVLMLGSILAIVGGIRLHRRIRETAAPSFSGRAMPLVLVAASTVLALWPAPIAGLVASVAEETLQNGER